MAKTNRFCYLVFSRPRKAIARHLSSRKRGDLFQPANLVFTSPLSRLSWTDWTKGLDGKEVWCGLKVWACFRGQMHRGAHGTVHTVPIRPSGLDLPSRLFSLPCLPGFLNKKKIGKYFCSAGSAPTQQTQELVWSQVEIWTYHNLKA